MSKQEISSPQELWNNLLDMSPDRFNGGYPDIDMLRDSYQRFSDREENKIAKLSFQKALDAWSDGQRRELICLFTESQEVSSISSEDLRKSMMKLYKEIFETEVQSQ